MSIAIIGTCDSKLNELLLLRELILEAGAPSVVLIDAGRSPVAHKNITINQEEVCKYASKPQDVSQLARGDVVKHMSGCAVACVKEMYEQRRIAGIISAGGTGGTSLVAPVMRESLPIGFPKLLVSTVASGDTGPLVGETDITMMYSVVDIAGSNSLLQRIFANAAGAIVGMASAYQKGLGSRDADKKVKKVGITMFGVTTPCVDAARQRLEEKYGYECFVFHATGHGGKAMERLVSAEELDAVLDITTTEVCDHLMGGNMSAGQERLEAAARAGIPCIVSVGATDMVNFGPRATVPERYQKRQLYEHNPTVTLMRTSKEECERVGSFIAGKLLKAKNPQKILVVLPTKGVSLIATPGASFEDAEADAATFTALHKGLDGSKIQVIDDPRAVNDEGFARDIADRLASML